LDVKQKTGFGHCEDVFTFNLLHKEVENFVLLMGFAKLMQ
jgi:hypothetical protein